MSACGVHITVPLPGAPEKPKRRKNASKLASFFFLPFRSVRDSVGIRTQDPQLRRLLLYPAELRNHPFGSAKIVIFLELKYELYADGGTNRYRSVFQEGEGAGGGVDGVDFDAVGVAAGAEEEPAVG